MSTHVDWSKLLAEIAYMLGEPVPGAEHLNDPVGTPTLAKHLARPRSTVLGWIDGKEPKHSDGEALIAFWCRLSGKTAVFVPLTRPPLSASKMKV
jgi:hypothetical protein